MKKVGYSLIGAGLMYYMYQPYVQTLALTIQQPDIYKQCIFKEYVTNLNILKRILQYKEKNEIISKQTSNTASKHGDLDIVQWLSIRGVYPEQIGLDDALCNGKIEIVNWITSSNRKDNQLYINTDCLWNAIEKGHLSVVQWINYVDYWTYPMLTKRRVINIKSKFK